jgi:two-component system sensor histidine kinase YesM
MDISKKMLIMLLLVSVIPIIVILFVSQQISTYTIESQTEELNVENLEQSSTNVQDFFKVYDQIIMDIYTDRSYVENLEYINIWDAKNYYIAKHEIEDKLENIAYIHKEILGIGIVGLNGDTIFYDSVTLSGEESYCFDIENIRQNELIKDSPSANQTIISNTIHKTDVKYGENYYFYIVHKLNDFNNYNKGSIGSIILCIDENALRDEYYSGKGTDVNATFIINQEGYIISFPEDEYVGENIYDEMYPYLDVEQAAKSFFRKNKLMESKKLDVHLQNIVENGFIILNVQDVNYSLKSVRYISYIIILIGILVCAICILTSMSVADSTDKSVKKIIKAMNKANKGDYEVQISIKGNDEFALISYHFNEMIYKIKKSYEQEREALLREKNAEIKSLEAQINPHFLYNTLDAINWVAIEHEEFSISKMLTSLATILRYSIHKSNEIVTIEQELDCLKKYIYLQKQRFDYSFECIIYLAESEKNCKIHKLLIQPFIENVIIHGFPGTTGSDTINISIHRKDDIYLEIQVIDNGKGVKQELVDKLNHYDFREDNIETSIGIRNVITRVKLYYGDKGHFQMESDETGTKVILLIPYEF